MSVPPIDRPPPPSFSPEALNRPPPRSFKPQAPPPTDHKIAISQKEKDLRNTVHRAKGIEAHEIHKALINALPQDVNALIESITDPSLQKTLRKLVATINDNSRDLTKANREVLQLIRKGLESKTYKENKEDESKPAVKILHRLLLASYTEPNVMQAFHELGNPLKSSKQLTLHEHLKKGRDRGYKRRLIKNDRSFEYFIKFFNQVIGAFFSTKFGTKVAGIFGAAYDPRGQLNNNTGKLFDADIAVSDKNISVRTVYTPSPTVGDEVAPEARGVLQAMKNRSKMTSEELSKDPYPYIAWNYTNLQSLASKDENARACSIMRLQDEFPDQFHGISVTLDSDFYRAGVHGKDEKKIEEAISDPSPLDEAYKQQQLGELLNDSNFTLEKRVENPGGGYYFPPAEKEDWQKACKEIVDKAFAACHKQKKTDDKMPQEKWNWYQKAAFRELVAMGIIAHSQKYAAQKIAAKCPPGKMMATNACKENIDRGGKTNACFLWAQGGNEMDVFSAFHARALLGRFRLVLPDRVEPMYALMRVLPQQEVRDFLGYNN